MATNQDPETQKPVKPDKTIREMLVNFIREDHTGKVWVPKSLRELIRQAADKAPGDECVQFLAEVIFIIARPDTTKDKYRYFD